MASSREFKIANKEFVAESMVKHQVSMFPEHSDVNDRRSTLITLCGFNVASLTAKNGFFYIGGRILCHHCGKEHVLRDIVKTMNDTQYALDLHETDCAYVKLASRIQDGGGGVLCSNGCNRQKVQVACLECGDTFCIGCALKQRECLRCNAQIKCVMNFYFSSV